MLTVKEGTNLSGLAGNVLRILEHRQAWKSAHVDRVEGQLMITGSRPSKVERVYNEVRVPKDAADISFSSELRRAAIAAVNWSDLRILNLQDAVADPGMTPLKADWSLIRDSSDKALDAMFALAVEWLHADGCAESVFEPGGWRSKSCSRKGTTEALEEKYREESFGRINRLWCRQHNPALKEQKRKEEYAESERARAAEARREADYIEHLKALITSIDDGLNKGLSVDPHSDYLQRAKRDLPVLLQAIKNVPSWYVDGRARPKSWLIEKATEAVFGKGAQ